MQTVTGSLQKVRIGTRGSPLALAQAYEVRDLLVAAHGMPESDVEIVVISTQGDRVLDRELKEIGGKGLFTQELEAQLHDGSIDIAVHSSKDMPTVLPEGLGITAYLEREDPRDAFIGRAAKTLMDMPKGSVVGSSSLRRQALIARARPDLKIVGFRGNVQTRLKKLDDGVADATLLANAGLRRLNLSSIITDLLDISIFPPAPGQGAICIEGRNGDARTDALVAPLNHLPTATALACERAFLGALDGSCRTPIAGHCSVDGDDLEFYGMILKPDGSEAHEVRLSARMGEAAATGQKAAHIVREAAGPSFFDGWS